MRLALLALAACGHAAAPAPEPRAPDAPSPVILPFDVIASGQDPSVITADDEHVWWLDDGGTLRRAGHDGSGATTLATIPDVSVGEMVVVDGTVIGATGDVWTLAAGDRAPRILASGIQAYDPVVIGDAVYFVDGDQTIEAVPRGGGDPVTAVDPAAAGHVVDLTSDGTDLYWSDTGEDHALRHGTIRRARPGGGKVELLASDQGMPGGLAVIGDRLFWTDRLGGMIISVPLTGGHPVVEMDGRGGWQIEGDRLGVVARSEGALFERPSGGPIAVRSLTGNTNDQIALTEDAIFLADSTHDRIVRFPRGGTALTVLASSDYQITSVARDGDRLDYLERGPPDRLMSVAATGGPARLVRTLSGRPFALAAGAGHVAIVDASGAVAVLGGAVIATDPLPSAVAIDRDAVYWIADARLETALLAGGPVRTLYTARRGMAYACASVGGPRSDDPRDCLPPRGQIARIGDDLVAGGGTLITPVRVAADGTATPIADDADALAVSADRIATWSGATGLTIDGRVVRAAGDAPVTMAGADPRGVWLTRGDDPPVSERVPWDGSAPDVRIDDLDIAAMVALDDAVVFVTAEGDLLLRLAR